MSLTDIFIIMYSKYIFYMPLVCPHKDSGPFNVSIILIMIDLFLGKYKWATHRYGPEVASTYPVKEKSDSSQGHVIINTIKEVYTTASSGACIRS